MKSEEEYYFKYSSTLRVFADELQLDEISKKLELTPTHTHIKGQIRPNSKDVWPHSMWSYKVPVREELPLEQHIEQLWEKLKPNKDYLKSLKAEHSVDVFLGYRSNCETAGFEISHTALEMFAALEIPLGVSIIVV